MQEYLSWAVTVIVIVVSVVINCMNNKKLISQKIDAILREYHAKCIEEIKELIRLLTYDSFNKQDYSSLYAFEIAAIEYIIENVFFNFSVWIKDKTNDADNCDELYTFILNIIDKPEIKTFIRDSILHTMKECDAYTRIEEKYDFIIKSLDYMPNKEEN